MPNVSVSVPSLPAALNVAQPKVSDAAAADNFLALLNVGVEPAGVRSEPNAPSEGKATEPAKDKRRDQTAQPVAAHIDAPLQLDNAKPVARVHADRAEVAVVRNNDAPAAPQDAAPSVKPDAIDNAGSADQASAAPAPDVAPDATKPLRTKIQEQLSAIDQLLQSILQALAIVPAPTNAPVQAGAVVSDAVEGASVIQVPVTANVPFVGVDASQSLTSDVLASQPAVVAGTAIASPVATSSADVNTPTDGVAILQDIQSILQQLQALVKVDSAPSSQVAAQPEQLQALSDALQTNTATLTQFLQIQSEGSVDEPLTTSTPQVGDVKSLLKDTVSQIKNQLQALKAVGDVAPAIQKSAFQAPVITVDPALAVAQAATVSQTKTSASENGHSTAVTNDAVVSVVSVAAPQAPAPVANTQANVSAVPLTISQNGANLSSDSDAQQGNDRPAPALQISAPASASGQAQAAEASYKTSFSNALDQAVKTPVAQQVAFHVKTALTDGSSKITIQLDPEELGKLSIKITVGADGKTGVVITADNKGALDLLQRDAQGLARALNDAGLQTDSGSLSFNLRGDQQNNGQGNERSQLAQNYQKAQPDADADIPVNVISRSYVVNLAEGLDIKI